MDFSTILNSQSSHGSVETEVWSSDCSLDGRLAAEGEMKMGEGEAKFEDHEEEKQDDNSSSDKGSVASTTPNITSQSVQRTIDADLLDVRSVRPRCMSVQTEQSSKKGRINRNAIANYKVASVLARLSPLKDSNQGLQRLSMKSRVNNPLLTLDR
ncbi:hypothetical protein DVH05_011525 [Phytophthora capsici]|nr:hypothetical protein DVH05_011525 [Phytophthora capsici]